MRRRRCSSLGSRRRSVSSSATTTRACIQFDDLAGFPIPDEARGGIRYAAPPGAIWEAQAVFFDEIGRCRPETANKLFPIVHERRIQGIALERLRYRWAATNPPAEALAGDRADDPYEGVEPLDPALADRFSYVVPLPHFAELSDDDRVAVIRGVGDRRLPDATRHVRELVEATRDLLGARSAELDDAAVAYVIALAPRLAEARVVVGGRRAATLKRNLVAIWAACLALGRPTGDSAFAAALLASVPDVVRRPVPRSVLLAAHRAAWSEVKLPESDPRRALAAVRDPLRRATLAVTLPGLPATDRGEALCSALAAMKAYEAEIVAWLLLPRLLRDPVVPATAIETVGEIVARVAVGGHIVRGACVVGWSTFILPFLFVLTPSLLMDGPGYLIVWNFVRILFALFIGTAGIVGFALAPLSFPMRVVYGVVALPIALPPETFTGGYTVNYIGIAAGVALLVIDHLRRRKQTAATAAPA